MTKPECRKNEDDYIKKLKDREKILDEHIEELLEEIQTLKSATQQVELIESEKLEELRRSECVLRWVNQSDTAKEGSSDEPLNLCTSEGRSIWRPYLDQTR